MYGKAGPMIYAGIDIAKNDHVVGATDEHGRDASKPMKFANSAGGFDRCVAYLEGLAESKSDLMVGMEATGHYWISLWEFLDANGYEVVVFDEKDGGGHENLKECWQPGQCIAAS